MECGGTCLQLCSALVSQREPTGTSHLVILHNFYFQALRVIRRHIVSLTTSTWAIRFSDFSAEVEILTHAAAEKNHSPKTRDTPLPCDLRPKEVILTKHRQGRYFMKPWKLNLTQRGCFLFCSPCSMMQPFPPLIITIIVIIVLGGRCLTHPQFCWGSTIAGHSGDEAE